MHQNEKKEQIRMVEEAGVLIMRRVKGFERLETDYIFPYITITLCISGSARASYDMQTMTQRKNDLAIILPGHIMRPLDCSNDYAYISMAISQSLYSELKAHVFSHDYRKFNASPMCHLTDIQTERLLKVMEIIHIIAQHRFGDLEHRRQMLLSQLAVAYEFVNYYRKEQDGPQEDDLQAVLFSQFCDLVVIHYRQAKDTLFYAREMDIHPRRLYQIVQEATHGLTPKEWIEQYVVTQGKHLIEAHPYQSFKLIAYALGFNEPSSFYRYFKRVTGMTAKEYRESTDAFCRI